MHARLPERTIYTIGHSNHSWDTFAPLLRAHGIQAAVDVRTNPVSRFAFFANRRSLPLLLEEEGLEYFYLGQTLGGKPSDPSCHDAKGRPDYGKIRSKAFFRQGINELINLSNDFVVAIMCAEEDPAHCHRRLLIGPALEEHEIKLLHIRKGGSVQTFDNLAEGTPPASGPAGPRPGKDEQPGYQAGC